MKELRWQCRLEIEWGKNFEEIFKYDEKPFKNYDFNLSEIVLGFQT